MSDDRSHTRAERLRQLSADRRENERQELRQLILDAAGELFAQEGYQAFSLRRVAEHIGYSPGAIYRYFDDKDDLLFNVADAGFKLFRSTQQAAAAADGDLKTKLRALAQAYVAFGTQHPYYYRLMFMERPDLLFKARKDQATEWLQALSEYQQVFTTAAEAGVLQTGDPVAMSDAWWSLLHGIVALAIALGFLFDQARIDRMLDSALVMLFDGFGVHP